MSCCASSTSCCASSRHEERRTCSRATWPSSAASRAASRRRRAPLLPAPVLDGTFEGLAMNKASRHQSSAEWAARAVTDLCDENHVWTTGWRPLRAHSDAHFKEARRRGRGTPRPRCALLQGHRAGARSRRAREMGHGRGVRRRRRRAPCQTHHSSRS